MYKYIFVCLFKFECAEGSQGSCVIGYLGIDPDIWISIGKSVSYKLIHGGI